MTQTTEGAKKAVVTLKAKYGDDYFKRNGSIGGKNWDKVLSPPKGFAANRELASAAGKVGGKKSKRPKKSEMAREVTTA